MTETNNVWNIFLEELNGCNNRGDEVESCAFLGSLVVVRFACGVALSGYFAKAALSCVRYRWVACRRGLLLSRNKRSKNAEAAGPFGDLTTSWFGTENNSPWTYVVHNQILFRLKHLFGFIRTCEGQVPACTV